jgi:hypothetical protein
MTADQRKGERYIVRLPRVGHGYLVVDLTTRKAVFSSESKDDCVAEAARLNAEDSEKSEFKVR